MASYLLVDDEIGYRLKLGTSVYAYAYLKLPRMA